MSEEVQIDTTLTYLGDSSLQLAKQVWEKLDEMGIEPDDKKLSEKVRITGTLNIERVDDDD